MFEKVKKDLERLHPEDKRSFRVFIAGLLSPGFQAILVYRFFHWCRKHNIPTQPLRYFIERLTEITTGISIPACCKIGGGLRIHHFGGVIFHSTAELGSNCTIYHEVTIGDTGGSGDAAKIGDNVMIGAGAKIIGEITIGNNCVIGANAVVTKNMPDNTLAIGNPAQIKPRKDRFSDITENAQRVTRNTQPST